MKKIIHVICLISLLFYSIVTPSQAYAQALPASQFAAAVGKTLMTKMKTRGFAANDPKFAATVQAASITLTDVAVTAASVGGSAVIGAVGAPVWLTLLASAAIGYGVKMCLDYFMPNLPPPKSTGSTNPEVQVSSSSVVPTFSYTQTVQVPNTDTTTRSPEYLDTTWYGGADFTRGIDGFFNYINSAPQYEVGYIAKNIVEGEILYGYDEASKSIGVSKYVTWIQQYCQGGIDIKPACTGSMRRIDERFSYASPGYCPSGYTWNMGAKACVPPVFVEKVETKTGTVQDAANNLVPVDQNVKGSPINPEIIAKIADAAWQRAAAQPGYNGVPYQYSDPVTQYDVSNAYNPQNNPMADPYPTVQEGLKPVSAPGTTIVINLNPSSNPTTPPASGIDLGPNPAIPQPILEATPTAQEILNPILNLFPSFKSFVVPQHVSECPMPSVNIFERHLILDGHCLLLEQVKPILYAVMAFVWVALGLFIILAA